jgi:hypothetical protein
VLELISGRDITATSHSDCQIKCYGQDGASMRQLILEGKINASKSDPGAHPHPKYIIENGDVTIELELAQKSTRVLEVFIKNKKSCNCE